jgi:hypothetical protein
MGHRRAVRRSLAACPSSWTVTQFTVPLCFAARSARNLLLDPPTAPQPTSAMATPLQYPSDAPQVFAFTDAQQRGWEVRAIRDPLLPERRARFLNPAYAGGWLLFTCGDERRRYAPLPPDWRNPSEAQLREWCSSATLVAGIPVPPRQPVAPSP